MKTLKNFKKFEEIFKNIFAKWIIFRDLIPIIRIFLAVAFFNKENNNFIKVVEVLIKEIKIAATNYSLDFDQLYENLTAGIIDNKEKELFYKNLFI